MPSSYVMEADGSIGITLGSYDPSRALVVDPTILFAGYLSGTSADVPIGIGHDKNGLIYLAGYSYSPDFPTVGTAYTGFFVNTNQQAFTTVMTRWITNGNLITYSGFFTGDFGDYLKAMAVDSEGVFYLAGYTDDFFFPVTSNAYLTANGGVRRDFVSVIDTKLPGMDGLTYSHLLRRNHDRYTHRNRGRRRQDLRHRVHNFRRLSGHRERLSEHAPGRDRLMDSWPSSTRRKAAPRAWWRAPIWAAAARTLRDRSPSPRTARCMWRATRARATSPPRQTPSVRFIPAAEMPSFPGST